MIGVLWFVLGCFCYVTVLINENLYLLLMLSVLPGYLTTGVRRLWFQLKTMT